MKLQVNILSADSQKKFVDEVQQAMDQGWEPLWESFRMVTTAEGGHQKIIFAIVVRKDDEENPYPR
jgi:hypothetical protein